MSGVGQAVFMNQRSFVIPPVNTVLPVITGTAQFGQTLSVSNGTWTGTTPITFTYQWQRVTTNISGATSSSYTLVGADVGNTIRCVVTATNAAAAVSATTANTATVSAGLPGAPTIGTATATGSTTATVAFTAPASDGGAAITLYTATSTPDGITGTLSQAGSGTITVTGLTGGTSYTFTVRATNAVGQGPASAASNSITTVPVIGQAFGGGFFAGQISTSANGVATHNLVVGARSSAASIAQFYNNSISYPPNEPDSLINGPSNTAKMIAEGGSAAANFCNNLVLGGFSDWYLGSPNEMKVVYTSLKPTTTNNQTTAGTNVQGNNLAGINLNAVPARTITYTAGDPAQTSAAVFQSGGAEAFLVSPSQFYWTSYIGNPDRGDSVLASPPNTGNALAIAFTYGGTNFGGLTTSSRVRAIRRVAV